jgi:hypothetical protein
MELLFQHLFKDKSTNRIGQSSDQGFGCMKVLSDAAIRFGLFLCLLALSITSNTGIPITGIIKGSGSHM